MSGPKLQHEHPTQLLASTLLRAVSERRPGAVWETLSRETRGLLEGLYAAHAGVSLRSAAGVESGGADARLAGVVAPLVASLEAALGGAERIGGYGIATARVVDRQTAYVLLLPDFGDERVVSEAEWAPSHLLAFVHESRDWFLDLARTAELSADAGLPDPLGGIGR